MSIEHSTISEGSRHGIANWEVASTAAMGALTVSIADIGKVAHVLGGGHYVLVDVSPSVWEAIATSDTLGLENVDNTSDADKPVSALQAAAISDGVQEAKDYADSQDVINLDAAKDYADALSTSALRDCGNFDASGGAYPSTGGTGVAGAIVKGNMWRISVAGTLPTGVIVGVGDWIRALIDSPGNTQANWAVSEANLGYVPIKSINGRTTQDSIVGEWAIEHESKLALFGTDCMEPYANSTIPTATIYGAAVSDVATATGMEDSTGLWKFLVNSTSSPIIDLYLCPTATIILTAEPIVLIASFSANSLGNSQAIGIALAATDIYGDILYGGDTTDGCCIVARSSLSSLSPGLHFRTKSGGSVSSYGGMAAGADNTRQTFIIVATTSSVKYYVNGTLMHTATTNIPTVPLKAGLFIRHTIGGSGDSGEYYLDLLKIGRVYKTTPRSLGIPSITY